MTRVALSLVVAVSSFGDRVTGQTFSTTADYAAFYKSRFDPRFESSSEPTIALWWTIEQFGDRNVPREKLRDYLLRHKELFRESEHAERVASFLKVIERMLDEKRPAADKKVERLIYDLRELNLRQWIHPNDGLRIFGPGALRIDDRSGKEDDGPDAAQQLRDLGYDVVPLLIEHLDDDTLTRSVDFGRDSTFSHRVLTVGDCCRQILDEIAPTGRQFDISADPKAGKTAMNNWYRQLIAKKKAEQSQTSECGRAGC